jgi:hypothetical protein
MAVPEIMEPDTPQTRIRRQPSPFMGQAARLHWIAVCLARPPGSGFPVSRRSSVRSASARSMISPPRRSSCAAPTAPPRGAICRASSCASTTAQCTSCKSQSKHSQLFRWSACAASTETPPIYLHRCSPSFAGNHQRKGSPSRRRAATSCTGCIRQIGSSLSRVRSRGIRRRAEPYRSRKGTCRNSCRRRGARAPCWSGMRNARPAIE